MASQSQVIAIVALTREADAVGLDGRSMNPSAEQSRKVVRAQVMADGIMRSR